jgi:S-adenosylmethionine hydrolase
MRNRIITLLSDFGTKDHYVASMKGVILGINPRSTLIDISHQIRPQDVQEGAFLLASAFSSFPIGTIHLSVVDPGVGGPRKPILIVTSRYYFIGPDNGIFSLALHREEVKQAVVLANHKYFLPRISSTFHGRDVFAPAAAHLSLGVRPESFGEAIGSWESLRVARPKQKGKELQGEILHIDAFGNLISNIDEMTLFNFARSHDFFIQRGRRMIHGLKRSYWEGKQGEVMALVGSGGFLEISIRERSAEKFLHMKKGDEIKVRIVEKVK